MTDATQRHIIIEAIESERRRMARLLQEQVIAQLNLMLAQTRAYEHSMTGNPQAQMAISVLSSLLKQTLQQTRIATAIGSMCPLWKKIAKAPQSLSG